MGSSWIREQVRFLGRFRRKVECVGEGIVKSGFINDHLAISNTDAS